MLAYYAHSEGCGHSHFATLFSKVFKEELKVFTSCPYYFPPQVNLVKLPTEDPDGTGIPAGKMPTPDYLHYSPVNQDSIKERSLKLLTSLIRGQCKLLIVDVSVEIAALARASSIPYAYVRLPGNRNDAAHLQAFQGAVFLLAYYPEEFEAAETPKWIRDKTLYLGFQSRFKFEKTTPKENEKIEKILVMTGKGNSQKVQQALERLEERFPYSSIDAIGEFEDNLKAYFPRIKFKGFVDEVEKHLQKADLVVSSCGLNATGEILASGKPFVCIPENRPFQEQEVTYNKLRQQNAAIAIDDLEKLTDRELITHQQINDLVGQNSISQLKLWLELNDFEPLVLQNKIDEFQSSLSNVEN